MTSNATIQRLDLSAPMSRRAMLGRPSLLLAALGAVMAPGVLPARTAAARNGNRDNRARS